MSRAETSLRVADKVGDGPVAFDMLEEAKAAGILAGRRAERCLPAVDAAEVERVDVEVHRVEEGLDIVATVVAFARQPVDGRAMLAANVCATNLVAEAAEVDGEITIERTDVTDRKGGDEGLEYDFDPPVEVEVATISDAVVDGEKEDRAGDLVAEAVRELGPHGVELAERRTIGDDPTTIEALVDHAVGEVDMLLTVGGTGLTHTDKTVQVVAPKLDRPIPGIMEQAREYGRRQTPLAFMSRGVAGLIGETLVVTLPGSSSGAEESVEALFPSVLHVFRVRRKSRRDLIDETMPEEVS